MREGPPGTRIISHYRGLKLIVAMGVGGYSTPWTYPCRAVKNDAYRADL